MVIKTDAAFDHYLRFGAEHWEPPWLRNTKIRAKLRSDDRRSARWLKKHAPELAAGAKALPPIPYVEAEEWDWSDVW
ncbi:hypothetical protein [Nocardioides baekrokdamisoli]|nr:hypothetical protein [Nocardioides baekrokdamisoli]